MPLVTSPTGSSDEQRCLGEARRLSSNCRPTRTGWFGRGRFVDAPQPTNSRLPGLTAKSARPDWVDLLAELVAVERHGGFETERVAGTEADGLDAEAFAGSDQLPQALSLPEEQMISQPSSPV